MATGELRGLGSNHRVRSVELLERRTLLAFGPDGWDFPVNNTTAGHQAWPAVAADADGDFVIAWSSAGQDGDEGGIYARRFDHLGQPRGNEFPVNTTTAGNQDYPAVAMDAAGNFVVAWEVYSGGSATSGPVTGCARVGSAPG